MSCAQYGSAVDSDEGLLNLPGACALAQSRCPVPKRQRELGPAPAELVDLSIVTTEV
jgi:hypothetical protein